MEDAEGKATAVVGAAASVAAAASKSTVDAAADLGSNVAQLSLSDSASSDEDKDASCDSDSWCSETESSDNNESTDALPLDGSASSSERGLAATAGAASVASTHREMAATGVTAKATNDLGARLPASGHPAQLTAEPLAPASATATLTKVPRVRRALGGSCSKTSKLAMARVDLPPLSSSKSAKRVAEHEPSARVGASSEGEAVASSSDSDSGSSDSDDGDGARAPRDEEAGRSGSARASGRAAMTTAATTRAVANGGGGVRHRSAASSHETMDAASSLNVDSVVVPVLPPPPLRGILGRKKDRPARSERRETATSHAATNGRGGSAGYTDSLALNIRLRKRPFTLVNRPRAEPPGNKPPSCLQKRQFVTFRKRHTVRDVKFDRDGTLLLSTRRSVQRYDANGHYVEQLFVERVVEPYGLWISTTGSGHVLVSDHREGVVLEFACGGSNAWSLVRSYGPVSSPRGVAQSPTGYVAVCAGEGQGVASRCVAVFHRHGQLHAVLGESKLRLPTHVTLTDSLVVVSDHARIVGFDTGGHRAFVYGAGTWHDYPASLCADADGFIVATDYYQSAVCALRRDRDRAHIVMDELHGLRHPTLVALSPFGHLLVVGERHSRGFVLKVFKLTD